MPTGSGAYHNENVLLLFFLIFCYKLNMALFIIIICLLKVTSQNISKSCHCGIFELDSTF